MNVPTPDVEQQTSEAKLPVARSRGVEYRVG